MKKLVGLVALLSICFSFAVGTAMAATGVNPVHGIPPILQISRKAADTEQLPSVVQQFVDSQGLKLIGFNASDDAILLDEQGSRVLMTKEFMEAVSTAVRADGDDVTAMFLDPASLMVIWNIIKIVWTAYFTAQQIFAIIDALGIIQGTGYTVNPWMPVCDIWYGVVTWY